MSKTSIRGSSNMPEVAKKLQERFSHLRETKGLTKVELAKQMKTSRSQVDRLLRPDKFNVTYGKLARFARLLEFNHVTMSLVDIENETATR